MPLLASCLRAGYEPATRDSRQRPEIWYDLSQLDARPTDRRVIDGSGDSDRPCVDPHTFPPDFTPSCPASCTAGGDCDGLPAYRDPYPAECNKLLYDDRFESDPLQTRWSSNSKTWSWGCSYLEQTSTELAVRTAAASAQLVQTSYLVEGKVTLGAVGTADPRWQAMILGRVTSSGAQFMGCGLWVNPSSGASNPALKPDVHVVLKNAESDKVYPDGIAAWPVPNTAAPAISVKEGDTYYLQLWYTPRVDRLWPSLAPPCSGNCPAVICRLLDETKELRWGMYAIYTDLTHLKYLPADPGTVGVSTFQRTARFDYVRVFALGDP